MPNLLSQIHSAILAPKSLAQLSPSELNQECLVLSQLIGEADAADEQVADQLIDERHAIDRSRLLARVKSRRIAKIVGQIRLECEYVVSSELLDLMALRLQRCQVERSRRRLREASARPAA